MPEDLIADAEELRGYVGEPIQRTLEKELDHLDHHCVDFLARSPIAMLSTSGADGRCDCSPRGGPRGFAARPAIPSTSRCPTTRATAARTPTST